MASCRDCFTMNELSVFEKKYSYLCLLQKCAQENTRIKSSGNYMEISGIAEVKIFQNFESIKKLIKKVASWVMLDRLMFSENDLKNFTKIINLLKQCIRFIDLSFNYHRFVVFVN